MRGFMFGFWLGLKFILLMSYMVFVLACCMTAFDNNAINFLGAMSVLLFIPLAWGMASYEKGE